MYNVYINERLLHICQQKQGLQDAELVFRLTGDESNEFIKELVTSFETQPLIQMMVFASSDMDKTWQTFTQLYTIIEAAGGVVFNDEGKLLMIYRNNKWDLPKGKIENGEQTDAAALREVMEECGLTQLELKKQLSITYHTYALSKQKILKRTYWFKMISNELVLNPQTEEGITEARWMNREEVLRACTQSYVAIVAIIKQYVLVANY